MLPSDTLTEAMRWLIELQTADRLEDIWDEFDDWFQASPAHRAAYARARHHWLELAGLPKPPMIRAPYRIAWRDLPKMASVAMAHWELILAVLIALVISI